MRKILGIIAEYNPFHNGHLYHYIQSKKKTGAEYTIAVMTGNFTQRGETSIINKWSKAKSALFNGIDLVIELPVIYSISSAENFASGSIKLLESLGVVTDIAFGAETDDVSILNDFADVLYNEPPEYKSILAHELDKGISFPNARENALMMYLNDIRKYANMLSSPNNILAIEYLKALKAQKSFMLPHAIKRMGANHNSKNITNNIASGTAIRDLVSVNDFESLKKLLPISSYSVLEEEMKNGHIVNGLSAFDKEIIYTLRKMPVAQIANLPDVSEGLEFAIKKAAQSCNSASELVNKVASKRYPITRIQRILLYSILSINKADMDLSKKIVPYVRVLATNNKGKELLSEISKINPHLNIITSVKRFQDSKPNKNLLSLLSIDIWATNVYTLGYEYDSSCNLDYLQKLITLDE